MPSPDWAGPSGLDPRAPIVTPEAVRLDLQHVGVGSRSLAYLLDLAVLIGIDLVITLGITILPDLPNTVLGVIVSVVVLCNLVGYHLLSELAMEGQTIGKRRNGLRVVMADGSAARTSAIVIRNLVRIIDFLPFWYAIGTIAMVVNTRSQRLGDLAAGTIVVRERRHAPPLTVATAGVLPTWADSLDVTAVDDRDYTLARGWIARRDQLPADRSAALAAQVAGVLRDRVVGIPDGTSDLALIPVVVSLVQQRSDR